MKKLIIYSTIMTCSFISLANNSIISNLKINSCRYYAYILYGDATLSNNINVFEKVYKESKILKSEEGFYACFNTYCSTTSEHWNVVNIGPYDGEAVCYIELQKQLAIIEHNGYIKYNNTKHLIMPITLHKYKKCE